MRILSGLAIALAFAVPLVQCGGAFDTCSKWKANGRVISAECSDGGGGTIWNDVDLDGCFANDDGHVVVSCSHQLT